MLLADVIRLHFATYQLQECNYMELKMVCDPFSYALHGAVGLDHANKNSNNRLQQSTIRCIAQEHHLIL